MNASSLPRTTIVGTDVVRSLTDDLVNPHDAVLVQFGLERRATRFVAASDDHTLTPRHSAVIEFVDKLLTFLPREHLIRLEGTRLLFQGDDEPSDVQSASWGRKEHYAHVCLLPDFYYSSEAGYEDFLRGDVVPWGERLDRVFWRGATTGRHGITLASLRSLPRYRLVCEGLGNPATDFAFYNVVQGASIDDEVAIELHLLEMNAWGEWHDMALYQKFKYFVNIDGNANSWGLLKKLRLGCCMLLVESDWLLWHSTALQPWMHYVPVASDLHNLNERIAWCLEHDKDAAAIAQRGRQHALAQSFDRDMRAGAISLVDHVVGVGQLAEA